MFERLKGHVGGRSRRGLVRLAAGMVIASTLVTTGGSPSDAQVGCTSYEIVMARGTWEPQDSAFLLPQVANRIRSQLGNAQTTVYDVRYPAQPDFATSAPQGITDLINHVNTRAAQCPSQRYILLGYSQGGLVVSDALSAPAARAYGATGGTLSAGASSRIAAVGTFGSMRFTAGETFNAGTPQAGRQSLLPRRPGTLTAYASRIMDYCYDGDWVCQNTGSFLTHIGYIFDGTAQQTVADFAVRTART
jgi:hypothetical protein